MSPAHAQITAAARDYARRFASITTLDDALARLAFLACGDAELAAVWLALPLDALGGRSPAEAWAEGDRAAVLATMPASGRN